MKRAWKCFFGAIKGAVRDHYRAKMDNERLREIDPADWLEHPHDND